MIADRAVAAMSDFVCGANEDGYHLTGVNFGRDLPEPEEYVDIRNVVEGDPSPDGRGRAGDLPGHRGRPHLPAAHQVLRGDERHLPRRGGAVAADGNGLLRHRRVAHRGRCHRAEPRRARHHLAPPIAPFQVAIAPIGYGKSAEVKALADRLHDELAAAGIDVLLDDRDERPGVMFADLELIGIPHRITIGDRGLKQGQVEYQSRREGKPQMVEVGRALEFAKALA